MGDLRVQRMLIRSGPTVIDASLGAKPEEAVLDARDFGATGDGSTDDTAALQAWVSYLATNGRPGYLPAGTYKLTAALDVPCRPGWSLLGAGANTAVLKQATDNTPILNLGSDAASFMHSWTIDGIGFDYSNSQPAANTGANPILFSQMGFQGRIENCRFMHGSYAIKVAAGIGCPWGTRFDNLRFDSGLTAGAMDWSAGVNAVPNNVFGRLFCDCLNMAGPVFAVRGVDFAIESIEFIRAYNAPQLMLFAAGSRVHIGALKLENGAYANSSGSKYLFQFQNGSVADIGHVMVYGNDLTFTITGGAVYLLRVDTGAGYVRVGFVDVSNTSATGNPYVFDVGGTSGALDVDRVLRTGAWLLHNNGSTTTGNYLRIGQYQNGRLSDDKGDADYAVVLGDPNVIAFQTAFTAPRTLTLPSTGTSMPNGLAYEVVANGAINGANTLAIKSNATTLRTQTTDKVALRYTWRRNVTAENGWVLTNYAALP